MTKINSKNGTATLSLSDSMVWASAHTPDARELDLVRSRVRNEVQEAADKLGRSIEIYACRRHGGHIVDVIDPQ